ncbi:MAG: NAD(P)-binding protein [Smithella sp.]
MKIGILGGGLSGIALAYFLQEYDRIESIDILEKESEPGGLCRSFQINGIFYDIGPHVIFSQDAEILDFMISLLGENKNKLRRMNKIYHKGSFIKYPFENELSALPAAEREYCLNTFLNNPYEKEKADNLLKYFLKTFGEGVTGIYLKPYNEKIWKFDPARMDAQMAGRIPKPPPEDIIKSAAGISTEGNLPQLYFYYPRQGGINALIKAFIDRFNQKVRIITEGNVVAVQKAGAQWRIETENHAARNYDFIISTIPVPLLSRIYQEEMLEEVRVSVNGLKYNSLLISVINVRKDNLGDNFAVMVPDENIIFHRLSKLNFLGDYYRKEDKSATLMAEITCSKDSTMNEMDVSEVEEKIIAGLEAARFIDTREQINFLKTRKFEYAYVICDLPHQRNMKIIKNYFSSQGVQLCGRFGEFEYLNMDAVIRHAKNLSEAIGTQI